MRSSKVSDVCTVLLGADAEAIRRTVGVAAGLFLFVVGVGLLRLSWANETPTLVWGVLRTYAVPAGSALPTTFGVVTVSGLAAINAYHNAGYLSSLLLAAAPSYAFWLVVGDDFARFSVALSPDWTLTPVWALSSVAPAVLVYGTLGFLLGFALRREAVAQLEAETDPEADTTALDR